MYKKITEYQYMPFIVNELEDIQGGGVLARADLKTEADIVPPGAIVGADSNGLYHLCKVAVLHASAAVDAVTYKVKKIHQLKVGEFYTSKDKADVKAYSITGINTSNADYDVVTFGTSLGVALVAGNHLVLVAAEDAAGGASVLKYAPQAITKKEILAVDNAGSGLLVRGTVKVVNMAYPVPQVFKNALSLVRFV